MLILRKFYIARLITLYSHVFVLFLIASWAVCIKWTRWFDRDNPGGTGDWELVSYLKKKYPKEFCDCLVYIDAVTVGDNVPAMSTGDVFYA